MPSIEGPKCNLVKIGQAVSEKNRFKDYEILGQIIQAYVNFDCN